MTHECSTSSASDERDMGVFIPSFLDDYGLDPHEFRVYSHIARRAGGGICFEGLKSIARCCLMDIKTVRQKIAVLVDMGMLRFKEQAGRPHNFTLTKHKDWKHPDFLPEIRSRHTPTKKGSTENGRGTESGTTKNGSPPLPKTVVPPTKNGSTPLPDLVPEGYPIKEIPLSESKEGNNDRLSNASLLDKCNRAISEFSSSLEGPCLENDLETESLANARSGKRTKSSGAGKKSKKPNKTASAKEIYASLSNLENFEKFYAWYVGKCKQSVRRDGSIPSPGKKPLAAIAWRDEIEFLNPEEYNRFRLGCQKFDWRQIGIPNADNFIKGRYWESALCEGGSEFLPDEAAVTEWIANPEPGMVAWIAKHWLPSRPEYRDTTVNVGIARAWLSDAKYNPQRMEQAQIAREEYQEHLLRQEATQAVVVGAIAEFVAPSEPSQEERIEQLNGMIRRGRMGAVRGLLATNPAWKLELDEVGQEVKCVAIA